MPPNALPQPAADYSICGACPTSHAARARVARIARV